MKKSCIWLFFVFMFIVCSSVFAQQNNYWLKIDETKIANSDLTRKFSAKNYQTYQLKLASINSTLKKVNSHNKTLVNSSLLVSFPDKNGTINTYKVKETAVLHPSLAQKYPNNKTYEGVAVNDSSKRIKFNTNILGLHAMIIKGNNIEYIDPVVGSTEYYRIYDRKSLPLDKSLAFQCLTKNIQNANKINTSKIANDKTLRTYRLALAATGEYSQFLIDRENAQNKSDSEKKEIVLAEMTTAITRINDLFENDLAISLQIIAGNEDIIFLDPSTDPYNNEDIDALIQENQTVCNNNIGVLNYDVGHLLSTNPDGGLASLGVTCGSSKARGVTGSRNPTGESFYFDFIAHELGHQFGAHHTFNGNESSCNGNFNSATAVEPGSGSTIMAYAGLCSPQNVQEHSDLYFHVVSINEIWNNISNGNGSNCGTVTDLQTNLHVPTVNAGNDYVVPKSTAFVLTGIGEDADDDPITFAWEQIDAGITIVPPSDVSTQGALFRSVQPSENPKRYFPELATVLRGSTSSKWEVVPSVARDLNFKLTVRDNNAEAGQTATDAIVVSVLDQAGPFLVSSQNESGTIWDLGSTQSITWDVAGTDANGIDVSHVNLLLSIDGGRTFDQVLKSNTLNDGQENIQVPNMAAYKCYVMVQSVGNIFYAVNKMAFSIGEFVEQCETVVAEDTPKPIPDNDVNGVVSVLNIAEMDEIASVKVKVDITHTWVGDIKITLESPDGTVVKLIENQCFGSGNENIDVTFDDQGQELNCINGIPSITGEVIPLEALSIFEGIDPSGEWKLRVIDDANQDLGTLEGWSLEICTAMPKLGVESKEMPNLVVYPNPTSGMFTIDFRGESDVTEVMLYDILGREIKRETFKNSSYNFRTTLNYQNISPGIYILKIKNGNHQGVRRLQFK